MSSQGNTTVLLPHEKLPIQQKKQKGSQSGENMKYELFSQYWDLKCRLNGVGLVSGSTTETSCDTLVS